MTCLRVAKQNGEIKTGCSELHVLSILTERLSFVTCASSRGGGSTCMPQCPDPVAGDANAV